MKYKFINGNKCIVFSIFKWKGINCFQFQVINEYQNKSIRSKHKWSMYYMQYIVHWPKRLYCQSHISKLWTFLEISQFQISRPHVGARLFHFSIAIFLYCFVQRSAIMTKIFNGFKHQDWVIGHLFLESNAFQWIWFSIPIVCNSWII